MEQNNNKEKEVTKNKKTNKSLSNLKERFLSFKWNHWLLISFVFIFLVICIYFLIGSSIKVSKGITIFGGDYTNPSNSKVGSTDYLMIIILVVLNIVMASLFVYLLFFSKVEYVQKQNKAIIKGRVVNIKEKESIKKNKETKGENKTTDNNIKEEPFIDDGFIHITKKKEKEVEEKTEEKDIDSSKEESK